MSQMIPLHIADRAVANCEAEIAKLREEVQRLDTLCKQLMAQHSDISFENIMLRAAGDTLVAAYCMGDCNKERWAEYPVVREWLAAKGELK